MSRFIYAQPPDLQAPYMEVPSVVHGNKTLTVGRHNVMKSLARLRGNNDGNHVSGFWVTMPLEWGHGMDDPAAAMPVQLIADVPSRHGNSGEYAQALAFVEPKSRTEQA